MKSAINHLFLFCLFTLLSVTACQDEVTEVDDPNAQETMVPNSGLTSLMSRTTANFGAADDILDGTSCFSVELPVTIVISDINIVIETEADVDQLEDLLEELNNDQDFLDFVFPITLIFSDYSELVIENEDQLESFISDCEEDDDVIDCVDFVYPISVSVFNSQFVITETIVIENDEVLYAFIEDLETNDNDLIVSLNYPVTLEYANGEILQVNSNEELSEAIESAEDVCDGDEEDGCDAEDVAIYLLECPWDFTDGTETYNNYQMVFIQNGDLLISEGIATSAIGGSWVLSLSDNGLPEIVISNLTAFSNDLEGSWLVIACDEDGELTIMRGDDVLELDQNCDLENDNALFNCFDDFELVACANDAGEAEFNLSADTIGLVNCTESFSPSFHNSLADAEANISALTDTESYGSITGQIYLRIEADSGNFEVFTIYLSAIECDLFECFASFDAVIELCDEGDNSIAWDLTSAFANCTPIADEVTYYETETDALASTNAIVMPEEYVNISDNQQTIYVRVEINNQFEIFTILLLIEDCSENECLEADVDAFLVDCIWNAVNYNGSDNLFEYNFDFELNSETVVIYTNEITINAMWTTSQSSDGVLIEFSNVAGSNIQVITGEWLVVECEEGRLELHRGADVFVLERNCD
jgi:hypothetical protein